MLKLTAFSFSVLLSAAPALGQIAEITVLPSPTPTPAAGRATTTVTTVTTTTTSADGETTASTVTGAPATPAPTISPTNESNAPAPGVWVDDGSMDTASQVERTRRNLRTGMTADPYLAGLVNRISMTSAGESITLTGEVNHSQEREAIERITKDAAGNLRVINSIRVR